MDFFSKTFYAHQFKDLYKLEMIIEKILDMLEEWEFVKVGDIKSPALAVKQISLRSTSRSPCTSREFVTADELDGDIGAKIKATRLGKRVAELYIDP